MKPGLFILTSFILCINFNSAAQKTYNSVKTDSSKTILRKEKFPCPPTGGVTEKTASPLLCYNFSSSLSATFIFLDSSDRITSKTDYTYYFDRDAYYTAFRESYHRKTQSNASFRIEELKDSIGFRANLNDSNKILVYKNCKKCSNTGVKYISAIVNQASLYKKTGNQKLIHGFLCEAFIFENDQLISTLWVTIKEDPWLIKIRKDIEYALYNELTIFPSGIVLSSESYYKQTKHKQRFEVTAMDKNASRIITTDGYRLLSGF